MSLLTDEVRSFIGRIGTTDVACDTVEQGAVRRYAQACMDTSARYLPSSEDPRFDGPVAPPLYPMNMFRRAPDTPDLWRASPMAAFVDVEVFSCETGLRKPDPAIYRAACDRLGVAPERCLYVGDGAYGELTGARAVGMTAYLVRDPGLHPDDALRPEPELAWDGPAVDDLRELLHVLP